MPTLDPTADELVAQVDLTDLDRFAGGFPHATLAALREREPVWWHPPTEHTPGGVGFWVVTDHATCVEVGGDAALYSSVAGPGQDGGGTLIEDLPVGFGPGVLLNMSDDPRHAAFRRLVNPSLLPRALGAIEADLRERARRIVTDAAARGDVDLLVDVAAELPLQAVAQLLGVPQADRHRLLGWANATLDYDDRDLGQVSERSQQAAAEMYAYGSELLERKRREPADDLLTVVATQHLDGAPLTDLEQQMLFNLMIAAGSETTRNTLAVGLVGLLGVDGLWDRLAADRTLLPGAVEEMLRWSSTTPYNRRTATRDHDLRGQQVRAGDKVTIWWAAANRDPAVFADPDAFDVTRSPNPHLAFGRGVHFCLGAALARLEIRLVLETLLDHVARIEPAGPVEYMRSNKHTGVRHMPVLMVPR